MSRAGTKFEFCFKGDDRQLNVIRSVSFLICISGILMKDLITFYWFFGGVNEKILFFIDF